MMPKTVDAQFASVMTRLQQAAQKERKLEAAQVKVLGMESLQLRAGANWPTVKDSIRSKILLFLERVLDAADIAIPCGDGYLIVFAAGDAEVCAAKSASLQRRFEEFFLGEQQLDGLDARVRRSGITAQQFGAIAQGAQASDIAQSQHVTPEFRYRFTEIWNVRAEKVAAAICEPQHVTLGELRTGYGHEHSSLSTGALSAPFLTTDLDLLERRMLAAELRASRGQYGGLGISMHWSTLRDRAGSGPYISRLKSFPLQLFQSTFIRVTDIPSGTPQSTVMRALEPLRGSSLKIWLSFHHAAYPAYWFTELGVWAIGIALPHHNDRLKPDAKVSLEHRIARWKSVAERHGKRLIVENIGSSVLNEFAKLTDVDLITREATDTAPEARKAG